MSAISTDWLGYLSMVLVCLGAAAAVAYSLLAPGSALPERLRRYEKALQRDLDFLHLHLSARAVWSSQAAAGGLVLVLACATDRWWPALLLLPVLVFPRFWMSTSRQKRIARIEEQLDRWLLVLANALKASASLGEAISSSAAHVRPPIGEEIDLVLKEFRLGTPLDEALGNVDRRIESRSLAGALLVMRVGRSTGGDLPSILQSAAASLREMARLEGLARTKTAEGRLQTMVIGAVPFALCGVLHLMDPDFFRPLAETFTGHLLVTASLLFWLAAIGAAYKIMAVDI